MSNNQEAIKYAKEKLGNWKNLKGAIWKRTGNERRPEKKTK